MKGNVIRLNIMHLNSVHLNSIGEVQSVSLKAGESTEDPVYPPTTYTLAANVSNGKVTATKNGTAISLPYVATEGDVIVLSVTPDEGYEFNGWLDGNNSNPRTVTMTGNVVLSASCVEIAKPTYTLSASVTNGKVSAKRNGSAVNLPFTANEGDTIIVEVTPNDGYEFNGWADGNTDNPRTITMTADVALSAQCVEVVAPPVGKYIQFEDPAVEAICVANWSSDGIGLTEEDAAKVTDIGTTFKGNTEITSFDEFRYFTGVTSLPNNAFEGCSNLLTTKIPATMTYLGALGFSGCTSLTDVGSLENVEEITSTFNNTPALAIVVNAPKLKKLDAMRAFTGSGIVGIESLGEITTIANGTGDSTGSFAMCQNLKYIKFPSTLEYIGNHSFRKCTALENITGLVGIHELAAASFYGCSSLKNADLGAGVIAINYRAFEGCSAMLNIVCRATTPPTLTTPTPFPTNNCPIYVPDASLEAYKTAVNWSAYADRIHPLSEIEGSPYIQFEDAEVESVLMAKGVSSDGIGITKEDAAAVTSIGTWFKGNTKITSFDELKYFTGVTAIPYAAFDSAINLNSLDMSNIVTIGAYGLKKTNLNTIIAPRLQEIALRALEASGVSKVLNLGTLTSLTERAFLNCDKLEVVILPNTLETIDAYAFSDIATSMTMVSKASLPPTLTTTFTNSTITAIYVPDASVGDYQAAINWSTYASRIKGISQLATDNPTLYAEIQQYL